jgi:uncharacterized protein with HEPN domain
MKKSAKLDNICCRKIISYLNDIKDAFEHFKINNYKDLEKTKLAHYAITQIITNLNSLRENLQVDTLASMKSFSCINLKAARNYASHAYHLLDFELIYNTCLRLTKDDIYTELQTVIKGGGQNDK